MEKPHKNHALYIGIFAQDAKSAHKTVRGICKQTLLSILQHAKPQEYLQTYEKTEKQQQKHELECALNENELLLIENDYINFQNFNSPKDNYHITSLFMGKNKDKLKKEDKQLLTNWKHGVKENIKIDFIVYIPNHIMAGFALPSEKVQVSNQFPHMTLLIKEKASAVESNSVLTALHEKLPQIFQKRNKKITFLSIPYGNISKSMVVIDMKFQVEGVTGDNCSFGKK